MTTHPGGRWWVIGRTDGRLDTFDDYGDAWGAAEASAMACRIPFMLLVDTETRKVERVRAEAKSQGVRS